jgi:hypothetical protein
MELNHVDRVHKNGSKGACLLLLPCEDSQKVCVYNQEVDPLETPNLQD